MWSTQWLRWFPIPRLVILIAGWFQELIRTLFYIGLNKFCINKQIEIYVKLAPSLS